MTLTGPGGLLSGIIGQVLQAGLAAELDAHLDGEDEGNRRNGSSAKTLNTEVGPVRVAVPRDRDGSFAPLLVPKQARRSEGLDAVITSLYAKGMSVRDIARHVRQTTGVDLSHDTVSRVTDQALDAMREWQHRPLEPFYPVIYVDALVAKVRDGSAVRNKAVNIAVGIDDEGAKHVLGIWVALGGGREGVGAGPGAAAEPGPGGGPVRVLRRADRARRRDHRDLAGHDGADLHGPPDPAQPGLRVL